MTDHDEGDAGETARSGRFLAPEAGGSPASPAPPSPTEEGWQSAAAKARLVVAAIALLVIGVLIGRLTAPDDDADVATGAQQEPGQDTTAPTFPAGDQSREPWWGLVGYQRIAVDTFDRPDARDDLGQTGTGDSWETPTGTWGIEGNVARLYGGDPAKPSIAVVPASDGDMLVEVLVVAPEQDAGLVFRYQDEKNFWAATANPSLGNWTVTRTVDGEQEAVAELNGTSQAGTTLTVVLNGTQMRFLIDSVDAASLDDSTFAGVRTAGLIAPAGSSSTARWDRFLTMELPPAEE